MDTAITVAVVGGVATVAAACVPVWLSSRAAQRRTQERVQGSSSPESKGDSADLGQPRRDAPRGPVKLGDVETPAGAGSTGPRARPKPPGRPSPQPPNGKDPAEIVLREVDQQASYAGLEGDELTATFLGDIGTTLHEHDKLRFKEGGRGNGADS